MKRFLCIITTLFSITGLPLMADTVLNYALQGSTVTEVIVPANSTEISVDVPFDPTQWELGHNRELRIELWEKGAGGLFLGSSVNNEPAFERGTNRARFFCHITMGVYREDQIPDGLSVGRAFFIGGLKYRQQTIKPQVEVRITSLQNGVEALMTYGMTATIVK